MSGIQFCPACRNMLSNISEENNVAFKVCLKPECGYKEPITKDNPLIYEHKLQKDKTVSLSMNPYLEFDPTLDHLHNMVCKNEECPSRSKGGPEPDVVAIKLNAEKLLWMYKCVNCKTIWEQTSRAS